MFAGMCALLACVYWADVRDLDTHADQSSRHLLLQESDRCNWLRERIESKKKYDAPTKKLLMMELIKGTSFEQFLIKRFGTEKRFGVDGCEVSISPLSKLQSAPALGAHSGRNRALVPV